MNTRNFSLLLIMSLVVVSPQLARTETEEIKPAEIHLKISDFAVPKNLGKIGDRFVGNSDRWVIQIQDVHAHFTVQENTAAILDQLNAVYGLKTVALEGGWLSTSLAKSHALPNSPKKQMLARALLEDAYLTGPGYAALFTSTPLELVGIEDPQLYEENRQIYLQHLSQREATAGKIETFVKSITEEKKAVFSPAAQAFDLELTGFREGSKADKFLPSLIVLADEKQADYSDLDQILLFKQILAAEVNLSKDKLQAESQRLMEGYKKSRLSFEELLRSGKIETEKMDLYPESKKYLELMKLQDGLSHLDFFHQIETVVARVKEKLFVSEPEKQLDARSEHFLLAKKIILFQATPDDIAAYEAQADVISSEISAAGLSDALKLGLEFYDIAKNRDEIFFEKITSDSKLSGDIAVVTGGFHTEGLSKQLREAGISYIVITPDLAGEAMDEKLYFDKLQITPRLSEIGSPVAAVQTLQFYLRYLEASFDESLFPEALGIFESENNLMKARDGIESNAPVSIVASLAPKVEGAVSMEDFLAMTDPNAQIAQVETWLKQTLGGKISIAILGMQKDLINDQTLPYWRLLREQRENTIVNVIAPGEDIHEEAIGGKARIDRIFEVADLSAAMEEPRVARTLEKFLKEDRAAAFVSKDSHLEHAKLRLVPADFPRALLFIRPLLEGSLIPSGNSDTQAQFWTVVTNLINEQSSLQSLLQAA